jgi:hypothetical protein
MKKNVLFFLFIIIGVTLSAQEEQKPTFQKASAKGIEESSKPKNATPDAGKPTFYKASAMGIEESAKPKNAAPDAGKPTFQKAAAGH